ncbi:MAG: glycoside hydrolase [Bacteroidota bacterium]
MRFLSLRTLALAVVLSVPCQAQLIAPQGLPPGQPYAATWFPEDFLAWTPEADPDAPYNRAAVPLAQRSAASGLRANAHARPGEAGVNALSAFATTNGNPSQGYLDLDYYAFARWPYVETLVFWGGSAAEGLILAPNPGIVDAAHRHGVPVYGTVFFPPVVYGGNLDWVRQFVRRDGDTYPVADQLIEVAEYFGFDGWFINQETEGADPEIARAFQEIAAHVERRSHVQVEWYDAMVEAGPVFWQERLNAWNDDFFQQPNRRVSSSMFLDFGWTAEDLEESAALARRLGRSPYELYAGIDYQARGIGDFVALAPQVFPEGRPHTTSLGIYRPDETFSLDRDTFAARERELWVGADGDPSREDDGWSGLAHYIPAATSITRLPFVTHFGVGQGTGYFVDGENVAAPAWRAEGWNHLSLQDLQPTWKWWTEGTASVRLDFERAYQGGSSLRIEVAGPEAAHVRLFATDLVLPEAARLGVAHRADGTAPFAVGLHFDTAPTEAVPIGFGAGADWTLDHANLAEFAGRRLVAISVVVSTIDLPVAFNVGRLAITEVEETVGAPRDVTVERRAEADDGSLAVGLTWTAPDEPVDRYEVFHRLGDGRRAFVGGTSGTAYFVPAVRPTGDSEAVLEVVAVGRTGTRSAAGTVTL